MKLALRDDFRSLDRLDDLFRDMWTGRLSAWRPPALGKLGQSFAPSTDVFKRGDDLVVRIELPGIDPEEDLTVEVSDGDLAIRGTRRETEEIQEDDYYRKEVWRGSYERHIPLPEGTDGDAVSADYSNGIVEVVVKGAARTAEEPPKPAAKTIPVNVRTDKA